MEDYDEDLSENPWYLAFIHNHDKLFLEITEERWIICVPRVGSWKGGNEAPKIFSSSHFESHCIKYEGEEVMPQKKDDDQSSGTAKRVNKYVSYNGKTVLVEGSKMTCGPGFEEATPSFDSKSGLLDLPPSGLYHTAKIMFEETYFNVNDQSYKMLCLSRPLELHMSLSQNNAHGSDDSPLSPVDVRFVDKLHSSHLWSRSSKPQRLKKSVDAKISAFIRNQGSNKTVAQQQNFEESWEMDEITGIDACEASVNTLFNSCLEIVMKDAKIKKETETNPMDNTKSAVEKYVLQEAYGSVFRQISSSVARKEAYFNKKLCNLLDLQPRDLGIDESYWLSLPRAKRHLSKINKCCTPQDKLSCIQQTIACIAAKQENLALGSDDLLPILIYLVIKSNIPNWVTNLVYLQRFQLVPANNEQQSFYVATLEAAIEHIKSDEGKIPLPTKEFELSSIQQYFESVTNGNTLNVKEILSVSATETKEQEQKMCHPLCTCDNCSKLKRRSATRSESMITVHTRNDKGQTALHLASSAGHHELVDLLVENGAELNVTDYHGSTPLHCAALHGSQSVLFLLLHHGANANATDNNNNTPLHLCAQRGHEACVKAFLYFDPTKSVEAVVMENDEGDTPLHIASKWGYVGIVSALMECGADPKLTNRRRQSSVDISLNDNISTTIKTAANEVVRIVRSLKHLQPVQENEPKKSDLKKVPRLRAMTPKELGDTIDNVYVAKQVEKLLRAVNDNDLNMVRFLCGWQTSEDDESTNLNAQCHPLCQCTKCKPLAPEHVLHANSSNLEKYTGLMYAAKNGYLDMAKLFLEHGASVNSRTKRQGMSSLHFACESGEAEIVRLIVSQDGANPDIRDENGSTPLYICAIKNFPDCAEALLTNNASLNIRNRNGDTPLHVAVKWKNIEVIELFLDRGALVYYKNNDNETALDFAKKDPGIRSLLLSASVSEKASSPTEEVQIGVSPHSPFPSSSTLTEEPSLSDEAIADNLYSKFKDPAPPTPPISAQCSHDSGLVFNNGTQVDFDRMTDDFENFTFEDSDSFHEIHLYPSNPNPGRKLPSTKSQTSDIFRDLLQSGEKESVELEEKGALVSENMEKSALLEDDIEKSVPSDDKQLVPSLDESCAPPAGDSYFEIG